VQRLLPAAQIVVECILIACALGIAIDLVTAHVAVEYFTVYHPPMVESESPLVMALVWGVVASWWFGAIGGGILAFVNLRRAVPLAPKAVRPMMVRACVAIWLVMMLVLVTAYGLIALLPPDQRRASFEADRRLMSVSLAHMTEYVLGGIAVVWAGWRIWKTP